MGPRSGRGAGCAPFRSDHCDDLCDPLPEALRPLPVVTFSSAIAAGYDAHIHLRRLTYIDHACLMMLMDWRENHEAAGGRLHLDRDILHRLIDEKAWRPANAT